MFALRLLVPSKDRRLWLRQVVEADEDLYVCASGPDLDDFERYHSAQPHAILVDLAHPRSSEGQFWSSLHVIFSGARLMALADFPIASTRIQAALHAGAYYMVEWTEPEGRIRDAARQAAAGLGFIPLGNILDAIVGYFHEGQELKGQIRIAGRQLDLARRVLRRDEDEVHLTALELNLLLFLIGNAGCPRSPAELAQAVWHQSPSSLHLTQQVKSAVRRLRVKLETQPNDPPVILNRHGYGYYIAPEALE